MTAVVGAAGGWRVVVGGGSMLWVVGGGWYVVVVTTGTTAGTGYHRHHCHYHSGVTTITKPTYKPPNFCTILFELTELVNGNLVLLTAINREFAQFLEYCNDAQQHNIFS